MIILYFLQTKMAQAFHSPYGVCWPDDRQGHGIGLDIPGYSDYKISMPVMPSFQSMKLCNKNLPEFTKFSVQANPLRNSRSSVEFEGESKELCANYVATTPKIYQETISYWILYQRLYFIHLMRWAWSQMVAILQTFSNTFSKIKFSHDSVK